MLNDGEGFGWDRGLTNRTQPSALLAEAGEHHRAGRLAVAEGLYRQAVVASPDDPVAITNLGDVLQRQGKLAEALACFRRVAGLQPDNPFSVYNLGNGLRQSGQWAEAAICYRRTVELKPDFADGHFNLGNMLGITGRLDQAVACYRRALALRPEVADIHYNLGNALLELARPDEAEACFRQAVALAPGDPDGHNNLGTALQRLGRAEEAEACFRRTLALRPDYPEAINNLGLTLRQQGRFPEAAAAHRRAIVLRPDDTEAHTCLAMVLLAQGEMEEGWREYEWRGLSSKERQWRREFPQTQWTGEPTQGGVLLVHAEQGFGDSLQFCRFAPLAAQRGWRVVMEAPPALVRLLTSLPGLERVIAQGEALPDFDCHCPMLSLPLALGATLADLPPPAPLRADPAAVDIWDRRLGPHPRIGLAWAGNPRPHSPDSTAIDRRRSIAPALLAPLAALGGLTLVSLQKGGPRAEFPLIDPMERMADFADTAALIGALDLVIAVDSAVAHLAASLGKPVWLLDRFDSCWRWMGEREDSPWYPTLRRFRQSRPGDWPGVIARVVAELGRFSPPCRHGRT